MSDYSVIRSIGYRTVDEIKLSVVLGESYAGSRVGDGVESLDVELVLAVDLSLLRNVTNRSARYDASRFLTELQHKLS